MAQLKTIKDDPHTVNIEVNHCDVVIQDSLGRLQIMAFATRSDMLDFIWKTAERFLNGKDAKVVIGNMPDIVMTVMACELPEYKVTYAYIMNPPTIN